MFVLDQQGPDIYGGGTLPPSWQANLNIPNDHSVLGMAEPNPTTIMLAIDTGHIVAIVAFKGILYYDHYLYPGRVKVLERGNFERFTTAEEVFGAMTEQSERYSQ
jgi:hypothetical protein